MEFVKKHRINTQTIEDRIKNMKEVAVHEWTPDEFAVICSLVLHDKNKINLYFIRDGESVYTASLRTAELFPTLPVTKEGMYVDE